MTPKHTQDFPPVPEDIPYDPISKADFFREKLAEGPADEMFAYKLFAGLVGNIALGYGGRRAGEALTELRELYAAYNEWKARS